MSDLKYPPSPKANLSWTEIAIGTFCVLFVGACACSYYNSLTVHAEHDTKMINTLIEKYANAILRNDREMVREFVSKVIRK